MKITLDDVWWIEKNPYDATQRWVVKHSGCNSKYGFTWLTNVISSGGCIHCNKQIPKQFINKIAVIHYSGQLNLGGSNGDV